ncbi:uncharacterized protein LOC101899017 [Musca domestica]|uniref:Uncharacterized protein LOC101899017 n=1 Tax=Musca domestica TaxID=7370 RepID=A0A1I8MUE7_MUSDO|nr:uncharacterized protein LOC101899017 [Musca domestica]
MIEILSLPRRPKEPTVDITKLKLKSGLPLNSLPGWELIPLNCKLPMVKCPGNQVIFSINKIGKIIKKKERQEFNVSTNESLPEYNPLQDSHLRSFYAIERNLKRLRENGEITENNDVICNLKDFNKYRQELHKAKVYYILQEMNRMDLEQRDRVLINNAEYITSCDHRNLAARQHSYNEVLQRKNTADQQRWERFKKLWKSKQDKINYIKATKTLESTTAEHQKLLRQLDMKRHWEQCHDIQRKKLIKFKKLIQFKSDRFHKNIKRLHTARTQQTGAKEMDLWKQRLAERIRNQEKIRSILSEIEREKQSYIEEHKANCREKWQMIQKEIRNRSLHNRRKLNLTMGKKDEGKNQNSKLTSNPSYCGDFQASFDKLLDEDVCKALNAVLDMEANSQVPFEANDPIYKAAQFIMQHILKKLKKDLSGDKEAFDSLSCRIGCFFDEAKKFVIFRSTQIISAIRKALAEGQCPNSSVFGNGSMSRPFLKRTSGGRVSFNNTSSTIGISSYEIHPLIEVREVGDRRPTPAGSLASIVVDSTASLLEKTHTSHLCRNELVFIEHYLTKFKRDLLVGIGRRVFAAIQCHFENKIMNVRQELLDIDRKFLVKQSTKSILRYAINPLDFESNLRLCISALSSDIIWSLQKVLLKMPTDPRRPIKPRANCQCMQENQM